MTPATAPAARSTPTASSAPIRPPLAVHILLFAEDDDGLPAALYRHLARDPGRPLTRGLGIPVRLWKDPTPEMVDAVTREPAARTAIVPIVGTGMVLDGRKVLAALRRVVKTRDARHAVFPIALDEDALGGPLGALHQIRAFAWPEAARTDRVLDEVTHDLYRLLTRTASGRPAPPLRLFLSYARKDGEQLAHAVSSYVNDHTAMSRFFGPNSVAHGTDFTDAIKGEVERAALVAFQTDSYGSREWCRREVLIAKAAGRPMVVVNAVRRGEERSFPYLGNVATVRWEGGDDPGEQAARTCALLLREALRVRYFEEEVRSRGLLSDGTHTTAYPPELCTLAALRRDAAEPAGAGTRILYADPPLPDEEAALLRTVAPTVELVTPHQAQARPTALRGRVVAISASASPETERRGWAEEQIDDLLVELGRYLYAAGATIAYGGDLRERGLTWSLVELARSYGTGSGAGPRLHLYLYWPYHETKLTRQGESKVRRDGVDVHRCARPADLPADVQAGNVDGNRPLTQRCLTAMRRELTSAAHAHVFVGGKLAGYAGAQPGLLEEASLAIAAKHPVYMIGALGGATAALVDTLRGTDAAAPFGEAGSAGEALASGLRGRGAAALRNGLSDAENAELFETTDLPRAIELVLLGLGRCVASPPGAAT